ncbi:MAG: hypothetical protein ABDI19_06135 [Armatimonadota bacterium]
MRLSDGVWELIATTQVGPRLIRFGFVGGQNLFWEHPEQQGKTGGSEWRIYGGHRLWHAPEHPIRTYAPDNDPIEWDWNGVRLVLRPPVEAPTGIQKEIEIRWHEGFIEVIHRLTNQNLWAVELAAWALSVMAPSGRAIIPQEPFRPHPEALLPVRPLALWAYTDMSDPRWRWGKRYLQLRQDPKMPTPQKCGVLNRQGWMAYLLRDELFLKRFDCLPEATYPDFGCNCEVFTNADMLELETLSPLMRLEPGATLVHVEWWSLHKMGELSEEEDALDAALAQRVQF